MPLFYDQLNRPVNITGTPKKFISVVPSQTELLYALGLNEQVTGITKFCIYPADKFKTTTKVGGTKQLNIEKIKSLKPDLIIANKEENERLQIEELAQYFPVWISDVNDLLTAIEMMNKVGEVVDRAEQARQISAGIFHRFNTIQETEVRLNALYLIWRKPYMVAGKNTFIDSMLHYCGLKNAMDTERYPEVTACSLMRINPDVVLLSTEPYPFNDAHIAELKLILPKAKVLLADGELFSWYGSRLLQAPAYFELLHKTLC